MVNEGIWWTAPAESESGRLIMVTGREDVEKFRMNPRFRIRVEVTWDYSGHEDASGMPDEPTAELMEEVLGRLQQGFSKDPVAVLTGVFTGDGIREMVFYTSSTHIFGRKINEMLADLPLLPLSISAENDPQWEAYDEMAEARIKLD